MNLPEKTNFIREEMFGLLAGLAAAAPARWGKMDAQQMLEHLNDFFSVSAGKLILPLAIPEEHLPKYREFLYSDKPFRENTKAPAAVLGDEPLPYRTASLPAAASALQNSVLDFFSYFKNNPGAQTGHPVFGQLTFDEWILLHHKHVLHHLRQFNLIN